MIWELYNIRNRICALSKIRFTPLPRFAGLNTPRDSSKIESLLRKRRELHFPATVKINLDSQAARAVGVRPGFDGPV